MVDHQTHLTQRALWLPWKNTIDVIAVFYGRRSMDEDYIPNQGESSQLEGLMERSLCREMKICLPLLYSVQLLKQQQFN